MAAGAGEEQATITIKRRNILQDLARSYTVFIDGSSWGRLWAFQTKSYDVAPGKHTVRFAIINTGTASSDTLHVDVAPGQTRTLRTHGRGLKNYLVLPLLAGPGIAAQRRGQPLRHRLYDGPWIKVRVEPADIPEGYPAGER